MDYSKALYTVDNTGEAIENRFSFDMITNSITNKEIKKESIKSCLPCKVELNEDNTKYSFLCNDCFKTQLDKIKGNK